MGPAFAEEIDGLISGKQGKRAAEIAVELSEVSWRTPELHKDLVQDIFGTLCALKDSQGDGVDVAAVQVEEERHGLLVACRDAGEQGAVCRRVRWRLGVLLTG